MATTVDGKHSTGPIGVSVVSIGMTRRHDQARQAGRGDYCPPSHSACRRLGAYGSLASGNNRLSSPYRRGGGMGNGRIPGITSAQRRLRVFHLVAPRNYWREVPARPTTDRGAALLHRGVACHGVAGLMRPVQLTILSFVCLDAGIDTHLIGPALNG
jgi:hypothetical protein